MLLTRFRSLSHLLRCSSRSVCLVSLTDLLTVWDMLSGKLPCILICLFEFISSVTQRKRDREREGERELGFNFNQFPNTFRRYNQDIFNNKLKRTKNRGLSLALFFPPSLFLSLSERNVTTFCTTPFSKS